MGNLVGTSLGRYHILEQLGEGGMATVYKAYDTRLERNVAVKIIRADQYAPAVLERILKRFEREAKALARLTHPNIVHINDYGEHEGIPYLVMDYLPGGTLKQRLGKPIPWQEAVRILLPIARALDYAHRQGMVHRDVKPSNILITADGEPMLTDFGIAKILESEETQTLTGTGVGVGTPEYMSPEQGLGEEIDGRADVYSLGIVLYEMVTGKKPYIADTPMAVVVKHVHDPLPRPSRYAPALPESVEKLLLKALAKKPEDRHADMEIMATTIEGLLAGENQVKLQGRKTRKIDDSPESTKQVVAPTREKEIEKQSTGTEKKKTWLPWVFGVGGVGLVFLVVILTMTRAGEKPVVPISTETQIRTPTRTALPTSIPTNTPISTETPLPTPTLGIGSIWVREKDVMVMMYVPDGEFKMGTTEEEAQLFVKRYLCSGCFDEVPQHTVYLDAFWIDRTEVTSTMFVIFLNEMGNQFEAGTIWFNAQSEGILIEQIDHKWQVKSGYEQNPAAGVTWYGARAYCEWSGARLPTEAEWEKAARGNSGSIYPGGDTLGWISFGGTRKVASSSGYAPSPYGAYDMAGNVWEWVADWYDETYYARSPLNNPIGPETGTYRILRGGSYGNDADNLRAANRRPYIPNNTYENIGFRCARDATP